jgi:GTP diphosphokinase / guanosine-3',5'-bis(diphosphate) 3'-diphosphatase
MVNIKDITDLMSAPREADILIIEKAYIFAERAHRGQKRFSGEDYISHLLETAKNLASYGMKSKAIAAGLLHDSIEDGVATEEEIRKEFGDEILFLVKGVTKLGGFKYKGTKRHAESLRRLFIAMSKDMRVLIIKFADRLHNMQTLQYVPEEKQKRIALETFEIYAPLAYRLGITKLSRELEDLSFKFLEPEEYEKVSNIIKNYTKTGIKYLEKISKTLKKSMAKESIKVLNTHHRVKGVKSSHKKIMDKGSEDSIHDILALRVIVPTIDDCYKTLGIVHNLWKPVPGRIKDFIALPKSNGYRSLHTTVFTGNGGLVEIQIRTEEMHREAEYGIAAHSKYKGERESVAFWIKKFKRIEDDSLIEKTPQWMQDLGNYEKESSPADFMRNIKQDFFGRRIFVLTPDGDAIDLPEGSTPIDFAYAIHSDIGNHISGIKINGKMGSIEKALENGDIVEIMTKKSPSPTVKWLKSTKTSVAKRYVRNFLDKETS